MKWLAVLATMLVAFAAHAAVRGGYSDPYIDRTDYVHGVIPSSQSFLNLDNRLLESQPANVFYSGPFDLTNANANEYVGAQNDCIVGGVQECIATTAAAVNLIGGGGERYYGIVLSILDPGAGASWTGTLSINNVDQVCDTDNDGDTEACACTISSGDSSCEILNYLGAHKNAIGTDTGEGFSIHITHTGTPNNDFALSSVSYKQLKKRKLGILGASVSGDDVCNSDDNGDGVFVTSGACDFAWAAVTERELATSWEVSRIGLSSGGAAGESNSGASMDDYQTTSDGGCLWDATVDTEVADLDVLVVQLGDNDALQGTKCDGSTPVTATVTGVAPISDATFSEALGDVVAQARTTNTDLKIILMIGNKFPARCAAASPDGCSDHDANGALEDYRDQMVLKCAADGQTYCPPEHPFTLFPVIGPPWLERTATGYLNVHPTKAGHRLYFDSFLSALELVVFDLDGGS